jgi:hypothetical protein
MTCVRTWHAWRCDGCGVEMNWEHGETAEAELPPGWRATLGWGVHACAAVCQEKIQTAHRALDGKLYIFLEPGERTFIHRPPSPAPPVVQPPPSRKRGRQPKAPPVAVFG